MSNPNVDDLQDRLEDWAKLYAESHGLSASDISLPTDFHPDEADWFLKAIAIGIIQVSPEGRCSLPGIHRSTRNPTEPCLFSHNHPFRKVCLVWREYITQVGALAILVLDYGWPLSLVALDPRDTTFDVAAFDSPSKSARMVVAGEVKKNVAELKRLLKQMSEAARTQLGVGPFVSPARGKKGPDGLTKFRGVLREKPGYFWAVAPGLRLAYRVICKTDGALLEEVSDLPTYAELSGPIS